jgi:predicted small lipoprotein YifL
LNVVRAVLVYLLLASLLITLGCGKKGPPYIPKKPVAVKVVDLKAERSGDDIVLEGKIGGLGEPGKEKPLTGLRVYVAQYPLEDPPCAGCPIEYKEYEDLGSEVIKGKAFSYRLKDRPEGRIYFFRMNIIGPEGTLGPPSNQVYIK